MNAVHWIFWSPVLMMSWSLIECDESPFKSDEVGCGILVFSSLETWTDARKKCISYSNDTKYRLIAIRDETTRNNLSNFLTQIDRIDQNYWIGAIRSSAIPRYATLRSEINDPYVTNMPQNLSTCWYLKDGTLTAGYDLCNTAKTYICQFKDDVCRKESFVKKTQPENGFCYSAFSDSTKDWYAARTHCLALGGDLITNKTENFAGLGLMSGQHYWTSFQNDPFEWSDIAADNKVKQTWFIKGRPSLENLCIVIAPGSGFAWDSLACTGKASFICERVDRCGPTPESTIYTYPNSSTDKTAGPRVTSPGPSNSNHPYDLAKSTIAADPRVTSPGPSNSNHPYDLANSTIAGIIVGCIVFYIISVVVTGLVIRYCRKQKQPEATASKPTKAPRVNSLPDPNVFKIYDYSVNPAFIQICPSSDSVYADNVIENHSCGTLIPRQFDNQPFDQLYDECSNDDSNVGADQMSRLQETKRDSIYETVN